LKVFSTVHWFGGGMRALATWPLGCAGDGEGADPRGHVFPPPAAHPAGKIALSGFFAAFISGHLTAATPPGAPSLSPRTGPA
jgi:hypothetical protein